MGTHTGLIHTYSAFCIHQEKALSLHHHAALSTIICSLKLICNLNSSMLYFQKVHLPINQHSNAIFTLKCLSDYTRTRYARSVA